MEQLEKLGKKFRSSILAEYAPMFLITLVFLLGIFYLANKTSQKEVWYGMPAKISMSNDFRFYQTDQKGQRIGNNWFWAVPIDTYDTKNIYKILEPSGIYKITGIRDEDDCNYYNDTEFAGMCVPNLTLLGISRIGTDKEYLRTAEITDEDEVLIKEIKEIWRNMYIEAVVEQGDSNFNAFVLLILEDTCPYYELDDVNYRQCMFDFIEKQKPLNTELEITKAENYCSDMANSTYTIGTGRINMYLSCLAFKLSHYTLYTPTAVPLLEPVSTR